MPPIPPSIPTAPHRLYRHYLKYLLRLPDPHAWALLQPYYRSLLTAGASSDRVSLGVGDGGRKEGGAVGGTEHARRGDAAMSMFLAPPQPHAESSRQAALREERRIRGLKRAREELKKLRAAVSHQSHALTRLLDEVYAIRGRERWRIINNISRVYPSSTPTSTSPHPPLPPPLRPLRPAPVGEPPQSPLARLRAPTPHALRKAKRRLWVRERDNTPVPLILPSAPASGSASISDDVSDTTTTTAWPTTGRGLESVISLRLLIGLPVPPLPIPLSPHPGPSSRPSVSDPDSDLSSKDHLGLGPTPPHRSHTRAALLPRPTALPTYPHLAPQFQRLLRSRPFAPPFSKAIIPIRLPRPGETRQNPSTWTRGRALTPRAIRRAYIKLWRRLVWVRPVSAESALESESESEPANANAANAKRGGAKAARSHGAVRWVRSTFLSAFPEFIPRFARTPDSESASSIEHGEDVKSTESEQETNREHATGTISERGGVSEQEAASGPRRHRAPPRSAPAPRPLATTTTTATATTSSKRSKRGTTGMHESAADTWEMLLRYSPAGPDDVRWARKWREQGQGREREREREHERERDREQDQDQGQGQQPEQGRGRMQPQGHGRGRGRGRDQRTGS